LSFSASAGPGKFFLGLDVGSISVKAALIDEEGRLADSLYLRHQGRPFVVLEKALRDLTRRFPAGSIAASAAVGAGDLAGLLGAEPASEITALTLAAETWPRALSLIDIGGEDTKVLWFGRENGRTVLNDFAMNALCAAGTGSFLDQQAHRLGLAFGRIRPPGFEKPGAAPGGGPVQRLCQERHDPPAAGGHSRL